MALKRKRGIQSAWKKSKKALEKELVISSKSYIVIDKAIRYFIKYYENLTDEELATLGFNDNSILNQYVQSNN